MKGREYIDQLRARGLYHFTTGRAITDLGTSAPAARAVIRRLRDKRLVATPYRGFHVIVPPEYRRLECLPPEQFVPELMEHLEEPYYAGLLSAASLHGAAHHQPQRFQVVVAKNRPDIECGHVRVEFIGRSNAALVPVTLLNTETGMMRVSIPEATAIDIVGYEDRCGGLDNVATVLAELADSLDASRLAEVGVELAQGAWLQRLGYLLDLVGAPDKTSVLAKFVKDNVREVAPLIPSRSMTGAPRDLKWLIAVNDTVEPEL